jgi:tetratricopeptide (TPR) repeat protein
MTADTDDDKIQAVDQLHRTARAAEAGGDFDRALGFYRAAGQIDPTNPKWALEAVRVLRKSERGEEADAALKAALRKWPKVFDSALFRKSLPNLAPTEEKHRKALGDDVPPDSALKRPVVTDDGAADVIVGEGVRKTAVLVFTGLADRMVMPLPLFDRYLAELDLTAVFLRDSKRLGYFTGVASLGDYDETIAALKDRLADMGVTRVHTLGNSAGGMGAVSYGLDLNANQVLGFSAPVSLLDKVAQIDRRTAVFNERLMKYVPEPRRDLRARIEAHAGDTHVHLYYGEEMPEDRFHAAALEGARNVHLHPLPGLAGHGALFSVAQSGQLRVLLRESFGEKD